MGNGVHAKMSPSKVDQWAVCTASLEAVKDIPDEQNIYGEEGTAAHLLFEAAVKSGVSPEDPGLKLAYDGVVKPYIGRKGCLIFSEVQVVVSEDCWGTADFIAIDNETRTLEVADLKWGKGHLVEASANQLKVYLCGARRTLSLYFDKPMETFRATIMQPRASHAEGLIRHAEYTAAELDRFEADLLATIEKIKAGDTHFQPTEKGCLWCKAKKGAPALGIGPCKAVASLALEAVKAQFSPIDKDGVMGMTVPPKSSVVSLTVAEIGAILSAKGLIEDFLKAVTGAAEGVLLAGGTIPEFKLVNGRANRKFVEEDEAALAKKLMDELKLKKSDIYEDKLKSPAGIEKMIDKDARNGKKKWETLQAMITKPNGKPTIVHESDKRESIVMLKETSNPLG